MMLLVDTLVQSFIIEIDLTYIRLTRTRGIVLRVGIKAYIDAAYGVHQDSGKSHTGCVVVLGDAGPTFAKLAKQKIVTKSSTEAELVGLPDTASQAIHLRNLIIAQGYDLGPAVIYQDNLSCIRINAEMSDSNQIVKMAGVFPPKFNNKTKANNNNPNDQIKYCYNYNESGNCRFGASCIYSHAKDPNHTTRKPRERPSNPDTSKTPINHVDKTNRAPNGGEKFKGGYKGKTPRVKFNKASSLDDTASMKTMIVNNESTIDQSTSSKIPFKSWGDLSEKPMVVVDISQENVSIKMTHSNILGSSDDESDFSDNEEIAEAHIQRAAESTNRNETIMFIHELQV